MEIGDWNTSEFRKFFFRFSSRLLDGDMSKGSNEIYEFGPFRLDVGEHVFERLDGTRNGSLPEKAFQTLTVLVRNHGNLVTKDELFEAVWPGTIVEENNLDKAVHAVRHALGEKRGEQNYIETVRKHGYRFVADVQKVGARESVTQIARAEAPVTNPKPVVFAIAITTLVALGLGFTFITAWNSPTRTTRSLFVLPLQLIGPAESRDAMLELGIADAIINRLATTDGLVVRSLYATRDYAGSPEDPVEAGRRQKVDYVLSSNYQRSEGKVRITTQLINVSTGSVEDSYKSEIEFRSLFGVQDAVAVDLGTKILRSLNLVDIAAAEDRGTNNEQAYRSYLEGMFHYDSRERDGATKAVAALARAVELDKNYARAWAGKAHAHLTAAGFGRDSDIHAENARAKEAIDYAISLNDRLGEAYSALCLRTLTYDYDLGAAEQYCKMAIDRAPNSGLAHQVYSRLLNSAGRHDEAIAEIKIAIDLEPASVFNQRLLGLAYHYARRYDEAAAQLERVMTIESRGSTLLWLTISLGMAGRDAEAFEWWKKNRSQVSDSERNQLNDAYRKEGWKGIMRLRAREFESSGLIYSHGAGFHAYIGEADKALELLDKAFMRREAYLPYVRVDPRFDPIRDDPRFAAFLKKINF